MKVSKKTLLLIAGTVWLIAGINILRIGLTVRTEKWSLHMCLLSLAVLLSFHFFVFRKMVGKHTCRIVGYEEELQPFYRFFNRQAYCIMAFMMTFGIGLRVSGLVPEFFIAVFYSGLGLSLIIAGLGFCRQFIKYP